MTMRWAVGMDGGGTKTAALCKQIDVSAPLRRSEAGPCNIAAMKPADAADNVLKCLSSLSILPADVVSLCIGVAGYSAVGRRSEFNDILRSRFPLAELEIVADYRIAHYGAFPDCIGVIVIAGTGSIAYGANPIGESAIVGGYGYLIDDSGTGYGLGRLVLVAAGSTFDGVAGRETLTALFTKQTGINSREGLVASVYGGPLDRVSIAALAPIVTEAAALDDEYARSLLMHAGGALARIAQTTMSKLFRPEEAVSIAKIGSLWNAGRELNTVFERSLLRSHPLAKVGFAANSPVEGALNRALVVLQAN